MWPWGHAALGYVVYSLSARLAGREVTGAATLAIVLATQLPDLVDKPLGWVFGVTSSGFSVGHSVLVAVPVGLAVAIVGDRVDRTDVGIAIVVGWWTHLVGDVLVAVADGQPRPLERILWPVSPPPPSQFDGGVLERLGEYFAAFLDRLATGEAGALAFLYVAPLLLALVLWLLDGAPGVRDATGRVGDPE